MILFVWLIFPRALSDCVEADNEPKVRHRLGAQEFLLLAVTDYLAVHAVFVSHDRG
jgi:hypothetical protein